MVLKHTCTGRALVSPWLSFHQMGHTNYRARSQEEDSETKSTEVIHGILVRNLSSCPYIGPGRRSWQRRISRGQQSHRQSWNDRTGMSRQQSVEVRYVDQPRNANARRDLGNAPSTFSVYIVKGEISLVKGIDITVSVATGTKDG